MLILSLFSFSPLSVSTVSTGKETEDKVAWDKEVASSEFVIDLFDWILYSTVNIRAKWAQTLAVTHLSVKIAVTHLSVNSVRKEKSNPYTVQKTYALFSFVAASSFPSLLSPCLSLCTVNTLITFGFFPTVSATAQLISTFTTCHTNAVTDEPGTLCQAGVLIKRGTEQMFFSTRLSILHPC